MKTSAKNRKSVWLAVLVFLAGRAPQVFASPAGLTVSSGHATAQQAGAQLNVTVSQLAIPSSSMSSATAAAARRRFLEISTPTAR